MTHFAVWAPPQERNESSLLLVAPHPDHATGSRIESPHKKASRASVGRCRTGNPKMYVKEKFDWYY